MTARDTVIEQLEQLDLGAAKVMPYATNLLVVDRPTVMVRVDNITPDPRARVWRRYDIALVLVVPKTEPGPADDQLDGLLEDVLHELEKDTTPLTWTAAKRAVFQEGYPAYEVVLSVPFDKEQ